MAKSIYVGVNGHATKVKKLFVGVNGEAKKVKKVYAGVNGEAKLCWSAIKPIAVGDLSDRYIFTSEKMNSGEWVSNTTPSAVYHLEYANGTYLYTMSQSLTAYVSSDLESWQKITLPFTEVRSQQPKLFTANNRFIINYGSEIWTSTDGFNWYRKHDLLIGITIPSVQKIAYGNVDGQNKYVAWVKHPQGDYEYIYTTSSLDSDWTLRNDWWITSSTYTVDLVPMDGKVYVITVNSNLLEIARVVDNGSLDWHKVAGDQAHYSYFGCAYDKDNGTIVIARAYCENEVLFHKAPLDTLVFTWLSFQSSYSKMRENTLVYTDGFYAFLYYNNSNTELRYITAESLEGTGTTSTVVNLGNYTPYGASIIVGGE